MHGVARAPCRARGGCREEEENCTWCATRKAWSQPQPHSSQAAASAPWHRHAAEPSSRVPRGMLCGILRLVRQMPGRGKSAPVPSTPMAHRGPQATSSAAKSRPNQTPAMQSSGRAGARAGSCWSVPMAQCGTEAAAQELHSAGTRAGLALPCTGMSSAHPKVPMHELLLHLCMLPGSAPLAQQPCSSSLNCPGLLAGTRGLLSCL